ncbi:hypothetical protein DPMN_141004 [Dreissena polymorpha]|uniref:Uncharacterized protein n=1 Tax=Dreissena polymorpha TaxID=45954 RepID=A0A9D4JJH8_DREPO|nr:hypothetical protein DPMN_141004 [Dreissena polymorpha]
MKQVMSSWKISNHRSSHIRMWSGLGNRTPTTFLQVSRKWAILSSCYHVSLIYAAPASIYRCHVSNTA